MNNNEREDHFDGLELERVVLLVIEVEDDYASIAAGLAERRFLRIKFNILRVSFRNCIRKC